MARFHVYFFDHLTFFYKFPTLCMGWLGLGSIMVLREGGQETGTLTSSRVLFDQHMHNASALTSGLSKGLSMLLWGKLPHFIWLIANGAFSFIFHLNQKCPPFHSGSWSRSWKDLIKQKGPEEPRGTALCPTSFWNVGQPGVLGGEPRTDIDGRRLAV